MLSKVRLKVRVYIKCAYSPIRENKTFYVVNKFICKLIFISSLICASNKSFPILRYIVVTISQ